MHALSIAPKRGAAPASVRPSKRPPTLKAIGERMREVRIRCGYSQSDVARLLDVAKQTISNWELGTAPPMLMSLIRFAAVTGIETSELLTGLSEDLAPADKALRRLAAASQLIPVHRIDIAGGLLMHALKDAQPDRFMATLHPHPPEAIAFTVQGNAMNERFVDGDVVTLVPVTMAEPGSLVLAHTDGRFVFRRFLPKIEGKVDGATLRALNPAYPDIEMRPGDAIVARMGEHVSVRHQD